MLPMDGRITQARFDSLVALIAGEKTTAEADRKAALQAAVRDRNGDSVRTDLTQEARVWCSDLVAGRGNSIA